MKTRTFLFFFSLLLFLSCRSVSTFETPNNLRNVYGTLYLANGKSFTGKLVVQVGDLFGSDVKLYAEGDKAPMHFHTNEVKGYRIQNDYYALKEKKSGGGIGRHLSFMKQLTADDSRLHLFEDTEKEVTAGKGSQHSRYRKGYYMQLPQEDEQHVYALGSSRFVPDFDEKLSRIVSDCPELAAKIAARQSGYFYAQVSLLEEKRREVMLRIINEYNRCK